MVGLISQSFPPRSKYTEADVPDLTGKIAVVTGANIGIGKETARVLLKSGAKVYIACRSEEKATQAIKDLKELTGKEALFLQLDLGSVKAAIKAGEELASKEEKIHLVFNNAGVMMPPAGSKTSDGYELQWGTNVVGHQAFTEALIPTLIKTAAASEPNDVRIITTSSSAHTLAIKGGVDLDDQFNKNKGGMPTYGQSKLGNVIQSQYLAEKLKPNGIVCISLNPGNISTNLTQHMPGFIASIMKATILHDVSLGAITQLYAGTSKDVTMNESGGFFVPWARVDKQATKEGDDKEFCAKVMDLVASQIKKSS